MADSQPTETRTGLDLLGSQWTTSEVFKLVKLTSSEAFKLVKPCSLERARLRQRCHTRDRFKFALGDSQLVSHESRARCVHPARTRFSVGRVETEQPMFLPSEVHTDMPVQCASALAMQRVQQGPKEPSRQRQIVGSGADSSCGGVCYDLPNMQRYCGNQLWALSGTARDGAASARNWVALLGTCASIA